MNFEEMIGKELSPVKRNVDFEIGDTVKVHYKIVVFVCPPAKASGHKPLRKQMLKLKPVAESWQPTTRAITAPNAEAAITPPMPQEYHPDDWLLF